MKKVFGWLIILAFLSVWFFNSALKHGWLVAAVTLVVGLATAALLIFAAWLISQE